MIIYCKIYNQILFQLCNWIMHLKFLNSHFWKCKIVLISSLTKLAIHGKIWRIWFSIIISVIKKYYLFIVLLTPTYLFYLLTSYYVHSNRNKDISNQETKTIPKNPHYLGQCDGDQQTSPINDSLRSKRCDPLIVSFLTTPCHTSPCRSVLVYFIPY